MSNYYFLASLLSELTIGSPSELSFHEFDKLLDSNLTPSDREQVRAIRRLYDIDNVRAMWNEEPHSQYGNYGLNDLDEALLTQSGLPGYVYEFLDRYDEKAERMRHYPGLLGAYFSEEISRSSGFLKEYLTFEREWRLVAAAYRAKVMGRNVGSELQHEDPNEDLVAQILAQKDSPSFEAPTRFEPLVSLLESKLDRPMEVHQAICEYRFSYLRGLVQDDFFSINKVLSYLVRLILVEEWLELDKRKGLEIMETIVKEAS
ncbi:Uncharacterized protein SCG7086_AD_00350 [Chlamydiales bacterium SCGC AG-110-P3]|nr:Uncharacterized protein SCG7086_AD_00350 [Chlamydiales bacterium SCGC AG-110-P3]